MRRTLEISAIIAATILIAMSFHAWLASHDEQLRMQATIATQKQLIEAADARASTTKPNNAASSSAEIPAADLKPLYDYVQDCRSCQAQLAAAQQNRVDDTSKLAAMTRERDAAVTAAKGGTFWRRLRRNLQWFAIGAIAGAAATTSLAYCHSTHCRQ